MSSVATVGDIYPGDLGRRIFGVTTPTGGIASTGGVDDVGAESNAPAFSLLAIVAVLVLARVVWELAK